LSTDKTIIRQSIINELLLCPLRVRLAQQTGYIPPFGESLAFGSVVHKYIENHWAGDSPSFHEAAEQVLQEEYQTSLTEIGNSEQFIAETQKAFHLWQLQVLPFIIKELPETKGVEFETTLELDLGDNIVYQGTPDLVLKGNSIHDFKTAKSMRKWTQDNVDTNFQASIYLAAWNSLHSDTLDTFYFHIYDRKKVEWVTYETVRDAKQQYLALQQARDFGRMVKYDALPATPVDENYSSKTRGWYCSPRWCGGWNICTSKYILPGDDLEQKATRVWQ